MPAKITASTGSKVESKRVAEVPEALEGLAISMDDLEKILGTLFERLIPVTDCSDAEKSSGVIKENSSGCALVNTIRLLESRVDSAIGTIHAQISHLEI
jgi:hypothetical protein